MEIDKLILKCFWKYKGPKIAKIPRGKKDKVLILSDFKTYYKAVVIRRVWIGIKIDK